MLRKEEYSKNTRIKREISQKVNQKRRQETWDRKDQNINSPGRPIFKKLQLQGKRMNKQM